MFPRLLGPFVTGRAAVGLLIMRIFFGVGMVAHGVQKIQAGPTHWADPIANMPMHLVIPPAMQALATVAEFCGGLSMIFGFLTPLGMLGIMATMCFAILKFHLARNAVYVPLSLPTDRPDYEAAAHYLIFATGLLFTGPGTLSLDALIFGRREAPPVAP